MARILVMDDDRATSTLIGNSLEGLGHEVLVEPDGELGLATARRTRPDLVIVDQAMPHLSGLEVCAELRRDPDLSLVPVIMLNAESRKGDVTRSFAAGAHDCLPKPFSPRELARRVNALLARSARRGERPVRA